MMLAHTWKKGGEREAEEIEKRTAKNLRSDDDGIKIYLSNRIYSEHDREVKSAEIIR
jgi:hypothetical protein